MKFSNQNVYYRCSCDDAQKFLLQHLYYCDDCCRINCPDCVGLETVSIYCPNCTFEVPSASVKAEKACCGRNCFKCPICIAPLLVHRGLRSEDSTTASHYLQCPSCGWNSNESNISFERPTGLAAQMQKKQQTRRDSIYFNDLKEYYDKCIRHYRGENTNNISKSFGAKLFATSSISRKKPAVLDAFQPSVSLPNDPELDIIDFDLENIELSTLDQKLQQTCTGTHIKDMSKAMPLRFPLRKKQAKLCRLCKKYLIKPDPKSLSIQFVTKLIAWNQLPRFSLLEPLPKLTLNQASEIRLEYLNPTQSYLSMNIDIDQVMNPNVKVDIMSTTLDELCPGKENWSSRDLMKKADYKAIFKCNVTPLVKGDISITLHVNAFYKKFENDQECNSALDCDIEVKLGTI